jgi:putative membrane protein
MLMMDLRRLSLLLLIAYAALTIYSIASILLGIGFNPLLTPLSSLFAFSFALTHSSQRLGWKYALLLFMTTFLVSLAFESLGVATGWVYGRYYYTGKLGFKIFNLVPLLIPVAWIMVSYPSFVITTRLVPGMKSVLAWRLSVAGIGAIVMTAWDLAMDPMMAAGGHWVWEEQGVYYGVPLQNYWGWWLTIFVALMLFLVLGRIQPSTFHMDSPGFDRLAILSYVFSGLSSILVDFRIGLGGPAMVGLFAMAPWAILSWFGTLRPNTAHPLSN